MAEQIRLTSRAQPQHRDVVTLAVRLFDAAEKVRAAWSWTMRVGGDEAGASRSERLQACLMAAGQTAEAIKVLRYGKEAGLLSADLLTDSSEDLQTWKQVTTSVRDQPPLVRYVFVLRNECFAHLDRCVARAFATDVINGEVDLPAIVSKTQRIGDTEYFWASEAISRHVFRESIDADPQTTLAQLPAIARAVFVLCGRLGLKAMQAAGLEFRVVPGDFQPPPPATSPAR